MQRGAGTQQPILHTGFRSQVPGLSHSSGATGVRHGTPPFPFCDFLLIKRTLPLSLFFLCWYFKNTDYLLWGEGTVFAPMLSAIQLSSLTFELCSDVASCSCLCFQLTFGMSPDSLLWLRVSQRTGCGKNSDMFHDGKHRTWASWLHVSSLLNWSLSAEWAHWSTHNSMGASASCLCAHLYSYGFKACQAPGWITQCTTK